MSWDDHQDRKPSGDFPDQDRGRDAKSRWHKKDGAGDRRGGSPRFAGSRGSRPVRDHFRQDRFADDRSGENRASNDRYRNDRYEGDRYQDASRETGRRQHDFARDRRADGGRFREDRGGQQRPDRFDRQDRPDRYEQNDRYDRYDRNDRYGRQDRYDRQDRDSRDRRDWTDRQDWDRRDRDRRNFDRERRDGHQDRYARPRDDVRRPARRFLGDRPRKQDEQREAVRGDAGSGTCACLQSVRELVPAGGIPDEQLLHEALNTVLPLKAAHRRELPYNIVQLSRLLTVDRAELKHPYWASPALTGAYVHYFLPWNIFRLSRLFAGLDLTPPADDGDRHLFVDLGSGPLTVPLALWLSSPAWRRAKVVLVAVDSAGHPLRLGKALLEHLAKAAGETPWEIHLVQAPVRQGIRKALDVARGCKPWLVTAANVLNELPPVQKPGNMADEQEPDEEGAGYDEAQESGEDFAHLEGLLQQVNSLLSRGPEQARALFVEPGTRLGGLTLMQLRSVARLGGMGILGPCPHANLCPLLKNQDDLFFDEDEQEGMVAKVAGRTWCHVTFAGAGAPDWLTRLAEPTGLAKDYLSLAWLLLKKADQEMADGSGALSALDALDEWDALDGADADGEDTPAPASSGAAAQQDTDEEQPEDTLAVRVVSGPFAVPGCAGKCRYACSGRGLLLLEDVEDIPNGALLSLKVDEQVIEQAPLDERSGARRLSLARGAERFAGCRRPAQATGKKFARDHRPEKQGQRPGEGRFRDQDRRSGRFEDRAGRDKKPFAGRRSRPDRKGR